MNWVAFAIAAWITLGLELGLRDALQLGNLDVAPHFAVILLVFVGLWAAPNAALAAALILGAALDVFFQQKLSDATDIVVLGPNALGGLLAGYTVLNLRAVMFRKNVLSLAFLCLVAGALMTIVATALLAIRSVYDDLLFGPAVAYLGQGLASALYTALLAIPFGFVLNLFRKPFHFQTERGSGFRIQ